MYVGGDVSSLLCDEAVALIEYVCGWGCEFIVLICSCCSHCMCEWVRMLVHCFVM